jgi:hypothetical protein
MSKPLLLTAAAASVLFLSGCATLSPQPTVAAASTRTYADSKDTVWRRILSTSAKKSMFIRQADTANGLITADQEIDTSGGNTIFNWAECSWDGVYNRSLSQRVEVHYVVRQEPNGTTTVTLKGQFRALREAPLQKARWVTCASTGVLERDLLEAIYYDG